MNPRYTKYYLPMLQDQQNQIQSLLKELDSAILGQKSEGLPLSVLQPIADQLGELLSNDPEWRQIEQEFLANHEHQVIQFGNNQMALLNAPWRLAQRNQPLADVSHLFWAKQLNGYRKEGVYEPTIPLPLRILVMISAPEDTQVERLLDFEAEEMQLLLAFEKLYENAAVQIDFCPDGSLEALQAKLKENAYHILHFSGHGVYHNGQTWLEMEDPVTLDRKLEPGTAFAEALNATPEKQTCIGGLIVLSNSYSRCRRRINHHHPCLAQDWYSCGHSHGLENF